MPRIVVSEFLTLDGVMQAPGAADEDRDGGFSHGGWQINHVDDEVGAFVMDGLNAIGGLLLGRRTYDIFAGYWPNEPADDPIPAIFNPIPKYVVSTSLHEPLPWENSHVISGDVPGAVRALRAGDGPDIQVIGSGQLVQTLIANDLVDAYQLMVHPLVLGTGKRLFREEAGNARVKLVNSKTTATGVLLLTYVPDRG
jgi:dihydrofolate reductase